MNEISIRFFDDKEVRAVWDDEDSKWWFSVTDFVGVLSQTPRPRNYWHVPRYRLKKAKSQVLLNCKRFKFMASDNKPRWTDCLTNDGLIALAKEFPGKEPNRFIERLTRGDETIDDQSEAKAYAIFGSSLFETIEVGTVKGLRQIHAYLFGGLYDFAGQIRTLDIAKGFFQFADARFLPETLASIERMPESSFEEIVAKYVEMNVGHPFMEGNGRSARIWLDLILKKNLKLQVDWSLIGKKDYMAAMRESVTNSTRIKALTQAALTDKINDREVFIRGVSQSYYYEEEDDFMEDDWDE
ncbi:MAG: Fic family protein [Deltaproteobacteria bacterium]|jgi:cell filamentation protein|nr:Fic family protein [Deltaproteobacteria bacterium]